ncbi:phage portal protein [Micromonospora sp. NPDC005652]|uniref:phage portal protein n=1 Tax=Micromonospora sp. NPDC005652 TaxID=3157046 RepID=UPI00340DE496
MIDVSVRDSPGWWMQRQFRRLANPKRRRRLQKLYDWQHGNAPLPDGTEFAKESFRAFMRQSRTNFAELLTSSVSERMVHHGFRTAVDGDETGDLAAVDLWERAGMDVRAADLHDLMLSMSEAYVIVDDETGAPIVSAEDPRWMIGEPDPLMPWRCLAALKVTHDDMDEVDRAYLYLPGKMYVATRPNRYGSASGGPDWWTSGSGEGLVRPNDYGPAPTVYFDARAWSWDEERGGADGQTLGTPGCPSFGSRPTKDGMGVFEPHLDLLSRITNVILQRTVVTTMQAFRQRAIKGLPNVYPEGHPRAGEEIDYTDVFSMDPAALWQIPATAEIWESNQASLDGILASIKDDVTQLAAVSKSPIHALMPAGQNQSAEGAAMQREGLVEKVSNQIKRTSHPWAWVMSLAFETLGDQRRADLAKLKVLWRSPERLSLAERADAASKAQDIPWRSRMLYIWEFPPSVVERMASERADEMLFQAQLAAQTAALQGADGLVPPATAGSSRPPVSPIPGESAVDVLADPLAGLPTPTDAGPAGEFV